MAETVNQYGAARMPRVYPLIFLAYGFSALAGPVIGGWLYDLSGSYSAAILIAVALAGAGAVAYRL